MSKATVKYYYNKDRAERPERFFKSVLLHPSGKKAGEPFLLENFQKDLLRRSHGWFHKSNDRIKHRFIWFEVPKGNGKSMLLSGLAVYKSIEAFLDGYRGAEIYCVAGDREQARIVFDSCKEMINSNSKLADRFIVLRDRIEHKKSKNFIRVISSEAYTKHGYRPYCIIFDEAHVQPSRELYDTLTRGLMKVENSQVYMITTAGHPGTFYEVMHNYANDILTGKKKNDAWLAIIYKANLPKDEKKAAGYIWTKKAWKEANPGYGTIIDPHDFEALVKEAKDISSARDAFKRLHLNIMTAGSSAWDVYEHWHKCNKGKISVSAGATCYGGLDLASTRDLSALVLYFPENGDIIARFWCPEDTVLQRTRGENINYSAWVSDGWVTSTPGNVQDYDYIETEIIKLAETYNIESIAYDRFNSTQLVINLTEKGIEMSPFGQGFGSMSTPTKEIEKAIVGGKLNHAGNPVLAWQVSNVVLDKNPADDIKPNKKKSTEKIDGIVSLVMAYGEYLTALANGPGQLDDNYEFTII